MAVGPGAAAMHRWMGQPLRAYADSELQLILIALERVMYGGQDTLDLLPRTELTEKIARLDRVLERVRCAPVAPAPRTGVPAERAPDLFVVAA